MMRLLLALILSCAFVIPCAGQFIPPGVPCPPPPFQSTYLGSYPALPNASQPVTLAVGYGFYLYSFDDPVAAVVDGNVINVTLFGIPWGFEPPPTSCVGATVGPLPVGIYTVNLYVQNTENPPTQPFLVSTATLLVSSDLSMIPTTSNASLAALVVLLALGGLFALYRHSAR